jgi:CDP-paratose 2-epimerase
MSTVLITGAGGLIGSEAARHFHSRGWDVLGVDNDMRAIFFGPAASTRWMRERLERDLSSYLHHDVDVRDQSAIQAIFEKARRSIELVIHTAAQPSHDWAAVDPITDFTVNADGTLVLLEATRRFAPDAPFIFTSTNKVYGDTPNRLPLIERETRFDLPEDHEWSDGIPETMTVDQSTHSLFGVSKTAADLLVQEYGRYFGMATAAFRGGCLTGPGHSGAELHGFLAYLMQCVATGAPYTVFGHKGKQVRDNIHSADLVSAFEWFSTRPRCGAVYNIGGGRRVNCSMLEAIRACERIAGRSLEWRYQDESRVGDHAWWISDTGAFEADCPEWTITRDLESILEEILEAGRERWSAGPPSGSRGAGPDQESRRSSV